jgi:ATP-dependent helicase/DNAse subunit B
VVDDEELLTAQDPERLGEFIPVSYTPKRVTGAANLITMEQLGKLKKRVEKNFATLAESLKNGRIPASPLVKSAKSDPCSYCEYKAICKRSDEDRRPYRKIDREELFREEEEV